MEKKGFIKKIRLISKFMTSQPGKQTITIHILTNILRSKGNQTMIGSGGAGSLSKIFSQLD